MFTRFSQLVIDAFESNKAAYGESGFMGDLEPCSNAKRFEFFGVRQKDDWMAYPGGFWKGRQTRLFRYYENEFRPAQPDCVEVALTPDERRDIALAYRAWKRREKQRLRDVKRCKTEAGRIASERAAGYP